MKTSKYVGQTYQGWEVINVYLAANYKHGTRHNAYRYMLARVTSDWVCIKKIAVSGPTMKKISMGAIDIEKLALKKGVTKTNYEFINRK